MSGTLYEVCPACGGGGQARRRNPSRREPCAACTPLGVVRSALTLARVEEAVRRAYALDAALAELAEAGRELQAAHVTGRLAAALAHARAILNLRRAA
jgi:reverse gyrase